MGMEENSKEVFVISLKVCQCEPHEKGFTMEALFGLVKDLQGLLELNEKHENYEFCAMIRDYMGEKNIPINRRELRQA